METLDVLTIGQSCIFCNDNVVNELLYGKLYKYEDIIAHHFCMLFSTELKQNGEDDEGIVGFLPADIEEVVKRGEKKPCTYCHHAGGTISCCVKYCRKKFHYACGVENGALYQFFGLFKSFCGSHRKVQNVPRSDCKLMQLNVCLVCFEKLKPVPSFSVIWAPCCKTAWFHRRCVQEMAVSAGLLFRCPQCNNEKKFRSEMLEHGIYIPDQDASWEHETNAFEELTVTYQHCDADQCVCLEGRSFAQSPGPWKMILCNLCGSQGIHSKCGEGKFDELRRWTCPMCSSIANGLPTFSELTEEPDPLNLNLPEQGESPLSIGSNDENVIEASTSHSTIKYEYIQVTVVEDSKTLNVPLEDDGSICLSTYCPGAISLKYRVNGRFRVVRYAHTNGKVHVYPPEDGWQDNTYYCIFPKEPTKRRIADDSIESSESKSAKVNGSSCSFRSNSSSGGGGGYYGSCSNYNGGDGNYNGGGSNYYGGGGDYNGGGSNYYGDGGNYNGGGSNYYGEGSDYNGCGGNYNGGGSNYFGGGGNYNGGGSNYYGGGGDYYGGSSGYDDRRRPWFPSGGREDSWRDCRQDKLPSYEDYSRCSARSGGGWSGRSADGNRWHDSVPSSSADLITSVAHAVKEVVLDVIGELKGRH